MVSALTNIGLDLLFVIRFDMGVAGVAWADVYKRQGIDTGTDEQQLIAANPVSRAVLFG